MPRQNFIEKMTPGELYHVAPPTDDIYEIVTLYTAKDDFPIIVEPYQKEWKDFKQALHVAYVHSGRTQSSAPKPTSKRPVARNALVSWSKPILLGQVEKEYIRNPFQNDSVQTTRRNRRNKKSGKLDGLSHRGHPDYLAAALHHMAFKHKQTSILTREALSDVQKIMQKLEHFFRDMLTHCNMGVEQWSSDSLKPLARESSRILLVFQGYEETTDARKLDKITIRCLITALRTLKQLGRAKNLLATQYHLQQYYETVNCLRLHVPSDMHQHVMYYDTVEQKEKRKSANDSKHKSRYNHHEVESRNTFSAPRHSEHVPKGLLRTLTDKADRFSSAHQLSTDATQTAKLLETYTSLSTLPSDEPAALAEAAFDMWSPSTIDEFKELPRALVDILHVIDESKIKVHNGLLVWKEFEDIVDQAIKCIEQPCVQRLFNIVKVMQHVKDEDVSFYAKQILDFRDGIDARQDLKLYLHAKSPPDPIRDTRKGSSETTVPVQGTRKGSSETTVPAQGTRKGSSEITVPVQDTKKKSSFKIVPVQDAKRKSSETPLLIQGTKRKSSETSDPTWDAVSNDDIMDLDEDCSAYLPASPGKVRRTLSVRSPNAQPDSKPLPTIVQQVKATIALCHSPRERIKAALNLRKPDARPKPWWYMDGIIYGAPCYNHKWSWWGMAAQFGTAVINGFDFLRGIPPILP